MTSQYKGSKVGFPIRRFLDQSSFAAPQDLSQRTTSFIASQRQGIHQMLLRHLITLMIDVRSAMTEHDPKERPVFRISPKDVFACQAYPAPTAAGRRLVRRTRCLLAEYAASLRFQTSAPLTQPGRARTSLTDPRPRSRSMDIPNIKHRVDQRPRRSKSNGGACRDRTDDLKLAKLPLSQLS
jgi:hypothetical protein